MTPWREVIVSLELFWPALLVAAALAVAAAISGLFVALRREGLAALAMPQVATLGVAVALRIGWPSLPVALAALALMIALLAWTGSGAAADMTLSACFVGALSLSILVIVNAAAHVNDIQNRFVGSDLAVDRLETVAAAPLLLILGGAMAALWRRWLLLAQAPAAAELAGLRPRLWEMLFHVLLAGVVLLGTNYVGVVMVLALLFLPAAAVLPWTGRIPQALSGCVLVAVLLLAAGFVMSVRMGWPFSHSVGGIGFVTMAASRAAARVCGR